MKLFKFAWINFFLHKILAIGLPNREGFVNKIFFYLKLILALFNSLLILKKEKPNFVFGLGGYVSLPICMAAKLLNIQILLCLLLIDMFVIECWLVGCERVSHIYYVSCLSSSKHIIHIIY